MIRRLASLLPAAALLAGVLTVPACAKVPAHCEIVKHDLKIQAAFLTADSLANCYGNYQPTSILQGFDVCTDGGIRLVFGEDSRYHDERYCNAWKNVAMSNWSPVYSNPSHLGWVQLFCTGYGRRAQEYRMAFKMQIQGELGQWLYAYNPNWIFAC